MGQRILFFDGVCNLCNFFVDFLIRRDRFAKLQYAPLQGTTAQKLLPQERISHLSTVIFFDTGKLYDQSDAVIHAIGYLPRPWCWLRFLSLLPKPIRDYLYRLIAKRRYRLFGRQDSCRVPMAHERQRLLD